MHCRTIQSNKIVGDQNSRKMLYSACCSMHKSSHIHFIRAQSTSSNREGMGVRHQREPVVDEASWSHAGERINAVRTHRPFMAMMRELIVMISILSGAQISAKVALVAQRSIIGPFPRDEEQRLNRPFRFLIIGIGFKVNVAMNSKLRSQSASVNGCKVKVAMQNSRDREIRYFPFFHHSPE